MYNWIGVAFAPTTIVAIIVLLVGIQQYMLAKEKLRLDSYDKRYILFEKLHNFLELIDNIRIEVEDSYMDECVTALDELISRIDDALFLFQDSNIYRNLIVIRIKGKIYIDQERAVQDIHKRTPKGTSKNTPRNLRTMRIAGESKNFLLGEGYKTKLMFTNYLVIKDNSPITDKIKNIYYINKIKFHGLKHKINIFTYRYIGFHLFPLSKDLLVAIFALEWMILICLFIVFK